MDTDNSQEASHDKRQSQHSAGHSASAAFNPILIIKSYDDERGLNEAKPSSLSGLNRESFPTNDHVPSVPTLPTERTALVCWLTNKSISGVAGRIRSRFLPPIQIVETDKHEIKRAHQDSLEGKNVLTSSLIRPDSASGRPSQPGLLIGRCSTISTKPGPFNVGVGAREENTADSKRSYRAWSIETFSYSEAIA